MAQDPEQSDFIPIADAIELPEDAQLSEVAESFWSAWKKLNTDRPLGAMGGAARIPWSKIEAFAEKHGFDPDHLARMMWAMDEVFLEHLADKAKRDPDS